MTERTGGNGELAFVFTGGGARGAYQVGLLRSIARRHPDLDVPILTGVSAGALNAVHLASRPGRFVDRVEELTRLWSELSIEQVFRVDSWSLLRRAFLWTAQLGLWGGTRAGPRVRGLVDTKPLADLLMRVLESDDGSLPGIDRSLERRALRSVAVTTTHFHSGETVTWCHGRDVQDWDRPGRRSGSTRLRVEHALASSALPVFFPAVAIDGEWYGDGAIRQHAPLAPAVHLGASRILAISTRYAGPRPTRRAAPVGEQAPYPEPAQILGVLLNAVFLDLLDQDALRLERINRLLEDRTTPAPEGLRPIGLRVLRPSRDLAKIALEYEPRLPSLFRWLLRRLGSREAEGDDVLSVLLFQGDYASRLIELGEADADTHADTIDALLEPGN